MKKPRGTKYPPVPDFWLKPEDATVVKFCWLMQSRAEEAHVASDGFAGKVSSAPCPLPGLQPPSCTPCLSPGLVTVCLVMSQLPGWPHVGSSMLGLSLLSAVAFDKIHRNVYV